MDLTPNGRWLITGSSDFTLRLWDLDSPDPATNSLVLPGLNGLLALDSDNDWVVAGSQDNIARVWPLNISKLVENACILAGRNLSKAEWGQFFPEKPYAKTCPQWPNGK